MRLGSFVSPLVARPAHPGPVNPYRTGWHRETVRCRQNKKAGDDPRLQVSLLLLPANTQVRDHLTITLDVALLQVVQKAATLADHLQQATAGVVVLAVDLEVLGEVADALREQGDLDLGRTGVVIAALVRER